MLPPEVRLLICSEALALPSVPLHILRGNSDYDELTQMDHWRCDDLDNEHMVWQHSCFGTWPEHGGSAQMYQFRSKFQQHSSSTTAELSSYKLTENSHE